MSDIKTSSLKKIGVVGLGALLGVGAAFIGSKIKKHHDQNQKPKNQVHNKKPSDPIPSSSNNKSSSFENSFTAIDAFHCPISLQLMSNPSIIVKCSHTFEKKNIMDWLSKNDKCPICGIPATVNDVKPNYNLKNVIIQMKKNQQRKLIQQMQQKHKNKMSLDAKDQKDQNNEQKLSIIEGQKQKIQYGKVQQECTQTIPQKNQTKE